MFFLNPGSPGFCHNLWALRQMYSPSTGQVVCSRFDLFFCFASWDPCDQQLFTMHPLDNFCFQPVPLTCSWKRELAVLTAWQCHTWSSIQIFPELASVPGQRSTHHTSRFHEHPVSLGLLIPNTHHRTSIRGRCDCRTNGSASYEHKLKCC